MQKPRVKREIVQACYYVCMYTKRGIIQIPIRGSKRGAERPDLKKAPSKRGQPLAATYAQMNVPQWWIVGGVGYMD